MVIKWSVGGESELNFGDRPGSSMSKFSASVNSDLGNGSFWVEIRDAKHVGQCSSISTRVWSNQLTSDLKKCTGAAYVYSWGCTSRGTYFFLGNICIAKGRRSEIERDKGMIKGHCNPNSDMKFTCLHWFWCCKQICSSSKFNLTRDRGKRVECYLHESWHTSFIMLIATQTCLRFFNFAQGISNDHSK